MKMRKYTAPDMRTALRQVRAEHGPDALILWTRRAAGVVELTVATDPEAAAHAESLAPPLRAVAGDPVPVPSRPASAPMSALKPPAADRPDDTVVSLSPKSVPSAALSAAPVPMPAGPAIDGELKALRRLLETQLAALAWNDLTRRSPVTAELLRETAALGLDRSLALGILEGIAATEDLSLARRGALDALRDRIPLIGDRWTEQGGTLVLAGPAGSGKTSALASIAARWVLRHGPAGAVLVSAGDHRFGAFEHLSRLGRLLGVPTYQIDDAAGLPELLGRLREHRLVLVDTPSAALRGEEADAYDRSITALRASGTVAVTLPATMQASALRMTAARYARLGATACIATRLDEAASLGGLLSAVIGSALPLAYVTDGTSLPDALRPARAEDLVALAVELVQRHGTAADEDLLSCRMAGGRDAAS